MATQGALFRIPTVAFSFPLSRFFLNDFFVVAADYRFHVGHRTVTHLNVISVENLTVLMALREVPVDEFKKFLCYLRFNVLAERGVKPDDISLSILPSILGFPWCKL